MSHGSIASAELAFRTAISTTFLATLLLGSPTANADPYTEGEWGPVIQWPHIPVSAANLPDGRILTWASNRHDAFPGGQPEYTWAATWDPQTGDFLDIPHPSHDMFCAHQVMLEDGRVFVSGGRNQANSPWTSIFDTNTNEWVPLENMNRGRWYPTSVVLPGDKVITAIGTGGGQYPDLYTPGAGWDLLTNIDLNPAILNYPSNQYGERNWWPLLHLRPDGKIFHSGPTPQMHIIEPGDNGLITPVGADDSHDWYAKHGTTIMYDEGKILTAGGWSNGNTQASTAKSMTIDISGPAPQITMIDPMNNPRKFHNGVMLPDGKVLVVGGNTSGAKFNDSGSIYVGETWDPANPNDPWVETAPSSVPRNYHSIALLLADGRVLSGGGGLCGNCAANHQDAQVFSPPYLFNPDGTLATRPEITSAPTRFNSGDSVAVQATPGITKFSFVRMSSTTHGVNSDARYIAPDFSDLGNGNYTISVHDNVNVMVPGYWMLFAVDAAGVPSVAKIVRINSTGKPWIANPGNQSSFTEDTVSLATTAGDGDAHVLTYSATGLPTGTAINPATGDITGTPTTAGNFNVTVTVDDSVDGTASASFTWLISEVGQNQITREVWSGISGTSIASLTGNPNYPDNPSFVEILTSFEAPVNVQDNFGSRIHGYIRPDVSGDYVFWISSDDNGQLSISPNIDPANKSQIASVPSWSSSRQWTKFPEQQSQTVSLEAGQRYYIEALQKEQGGGDNLAVAWQRPGTSGPVVIDGAYLSPFANIPNIAPAGTVSQSSDYLGDATYGAAKATDNNTDGVAANGSVAITGNDNEAWWQIDLGDFYDIDSITLWNRSDCCANRLSDFHVLVSETPFESTDLAATINQTGVRDYPHAGTAGAVSNTSVGQLARYVRIQLSGQDHLQLAEVQIYGTPGDTSAPPVIEEIVSLPSTPGSAISYSANTMGGVGLLYRWSFGDGTPETANSSSPDITHTFSAPGRYVVTLTVTDANGDEYTITFTQTVHWPLTNGAPAQSSSIIFDGAAGRVWNVNPDNDTVSAFNTSNNTKAAELPVGDNPRSLARDTSHYLWVTNKSSGSITIIDTLTLTEATTVTLNPGAQPHGIVFHPDGSKAYIALQGLGEVLVLDAFNWTELGRIPVGPNVRHLAIDFSGAELYVSRFVTPPLPGESTAAPQTSSGPDLLGGEVVVVDPNAFSVLETIVLQHSERPDAEHSGRGIPNYVGALAISPNGGSAWVPSKQDNIKRGELRDLQYLTHDSTVRSISSRIDLSTNTEDYAARVDHDDSSMSSHSIFGPYGTYVFTALEGNRQIAVIDVFEESDRWRIDVGRAVQGIALSNDGRTLYAHNFMDRTVSVVDISRIIDESILETTTVATLNAVASESLAADILVGKQFFYDAKDQRLTAESYMSCASCHNEGGGDGRVWDFTNFGEGVRNTINLNGRNAQHGKLHWTANFDEVQDFEGQIRNFAGGTGLMSNADFNAGTRWDPLGDTKAGFSADLDALAAYVNSLGAAGFSPYRDADGSLTSRGETGKLLFESLGCDSCHGAPTFTDSGLDAMHDVGTLVDPDSGSTIALDTPTLRGLWRSAPYLHNGSAATIANAIDQHSAFSLTPTELGDLESYLLQIDDHVAVGATLDAGPLGRGLTGLDGATGIAYVIWTEERIQTRFTSPPIDPNSADHFFVARYLNGNWQYMTDNEFVTFTPRPNDLIIAELNLSADTVNDLKGTDGVIGGIRSGYFDGDIVITPDMWNGSVDEGEFGISGTFIITNGGPPPPPPPPNNPPAVGNPGIQTNTVGDAVSLAISASDSDGDTLTYSASGLPAGLGINASTGIITGIPFASGLNTATVSVSDQEDTTSVSFAWQINSNPGGGGETLSIGPLGRGLTGLDSASGLGYAMYTAERIQTRFASTPIDPNSADHIFVARYLNGNWQYATDNTFVTFTPRSTDLLVAEIDFSADTVNHLLSVDANINGIDAGYAASDMVITPNMWNGSPDAGEFGLSGTFITKNSGPPPPPNNPPVLTDPGNLTGTVGDTVAFNLDATDSDGDPLTYSATGLPTGVSLDAASGALSGSLLESGTFDVTFVVSDGKGGIDSRAIVWTVDLGGGLVSLDIGRLGRGLTGLDSATGTGYAIYTAERIQTRFHRHADRSRFRGPCVRRALPERFMAVRNGRCVCYLHATCHGSSRRRARFLG